MTDTRKEFEEWFENMYGKKPMPIPRNGDDPHESVYMTMFADGASRSWQACQSLNDKRIQQLLAVIAKKDEALQIAIEYQEGACQYFHDAMAGYKEQEHERYRDDLKETKSALAIKPENVELVEVAVEDHFCAVITEIGGYTKYNGPTVYTIKTKA